MKELTAKQKEEIVADFLKETKGELLFHITNYLMIRLAEEAIQANAEVLKMSTSIHPKGIDERRDISLVVFQKRQSENNVKDLSSLLQAAPEMFERLQKVKLMLQAHPDYVCNEDGEFHDQVDSIEEVINKALGKE
jgi:hypothetical protein